MPGYQLNHAVVDVTTPPIAEAKAWVKEGHAGGDGQLIDLAQAVPSYPPPTGLMDYLAEFVHRPESAFYTDILGLRELRLDYAAHLTSDYAGAIAAENIAITPGCNNAYCLATMALAGPGDEIILPTPYYFNHDMWLSMTGVTAKFLPTRQTVDGMLPNVDEARNLITNKTRAILLVTPNNPTGTIYSEDLIRRFAALAKEAGIALILDETYKDFRHELSPPHRLFQAPDWADHLIHLYSFSKAFSLAGYRVGAITGAPEMIETVGKIADTLNICTSHVGQQAAYYGLNNLGSWQAEKRTGLLSLIETLDREFSPAPGGFELASRGAFFAFLRHPFEGKSARDVAKQLVAEAQVLCLPGSFFGPDQENYLRIAFANTDQAGIGEAARRLSLLKA